MNNQIFLRWLDTWISDLPTKTFEDFDDPKRIAIVSVDMVNGFCDKGSLASKEVKNIIPSVVGVLKKAHASGIKNFLLLQDAHKENAEEFEAFPPHCIKGTKESQTIPEIADLPFANMYTIFEKNAWSPAYDTQFNPWIKNHPEIETFIIVGDCTDICVHAVAMHLRMQANALQIKRKIVIPANAVGTYDLTIEKAKEIGALPHDSKMLHNIFLYHMALCAIEIVKEVK